MTTCDIVRELIHLFMAPTHKDPWSINNANPPMCHLAQTISGSHFSS